MLIHPYRQRNQLTTVGDSRVLTETLGLIGAEIRDPTNLRRRWFIQGVYAPIPGRVLGGIRAKVEDEKGFISFINQRDLEVLLGLVKPGDYCPWTDEDYPDTSHRSWFGLCADDDDLVDDLYEKELSFRSETEDGVLPEGLELTRRVHLDRGNDVQELWAFLGDVDPETGIWPDPRFKTVERRWIRVERVRVEWHKTWQ